MEHCTKLPVKFNQIITVGTGSSGNSYLLQLSDGKYIALDCGMPWKQVLIGCDWQPTMIDLALYTHSHKDHAYYSKYFVSNGIDVYGPDNWQDKKPKRIGGCIVAPFEVPHDVPCYGYLISTGTEKLIYMTDFGYCKYTFKTQEVDHWLIACNHIELPEREENKFRHVVTGHSSLDTVKDLLVASQTDKMRNVIICHYSEGQDTNRMVQELSTALGNTVNVGIAQKGQKCQLQTL